MADIQNPPRGARTHGMATWLPASRLLPALALALGLSACQTSMTALAPSGGGNAPGTQVSFLSIQGPAPELAQKFEAVLAQEARKRGFEVIAGAGGPTTLKVKTYLDAYASDDGKTGFAWVLDASENGKTRAARIKGAAQMSAPPSAPWSALDETAMRQIAQMSIDDLVRHASGAPPAVAQVDTAE